MDKPLTERTLSDAIPFWDDWLCGCDGTTTCDDHMPECDGHESLAGAAMGLTVYCDGSCITRH